MTFTRRKTGHAEMQPLEQKVVCGLNVAPDKVTLTYVFRGASFISRLNCFATVPLV